MTVKVRELGEWQLCPKCNGNGFITNPFATLTNVTQTCDVCFGAKILMRPVIERIVHRMSPKFKKKPDLLLIKTKNKI